MGKKMVSLRFLLLASMVTFCISGCGESDKSSSTAATSTAKTASWTNVSVRALDGTININWDKAAGSAFGAAQITYNLYCSTSPTDIVQDKNRIATNYVGQSFDHSNATNGQRNYYVVTAVSGGAEGPASRVVSATPETTRPAAPYGLKVTALDASAKLEFMGPTPLSSVAVSYNLYRSTTRNFTADSTTKIESKIPAAKLSPYVDSDPNLSNNTTYYYAITAVIADKESEISPVVSARPMVTVAAVDSSPTQLAVFASPTNMSAEPGNGSCIIRWTDVATINISLPDPAAAPTQATPDYILYRSYTPDILSDNNKVAIDNVPKDATSGGYKLSGLNNGTTYYLQLVAAVKDVDGKAIAGRYTPGPVVSVTPALKAPATPVGVSATQGPQQVILTWSKDSYRITGVTYNVYFSTTNATTPAELRANGIRRNNVDSTKTYFTHTGLQTGISYYYVVTAVGDGENEGESAPSNIVSVTL